MKTKKIRWVTYSDSDETLKKLDYNRSLLSKQERFFEDISDERNNVTQ